MVILDVTNNTLDTVIFNPKEMLGILDLRLTGYFRVKHARYERIEAIYMVWRISQTKASSITLPEVSTVDKAVDTDVYLEKWVRKSIIHSEVKYVIHNKLKE